MAYEVHLGGCALYGVSAVEESAPRSVTEHDGIGSGAFAIPQNAGLKSWSIRLELTEQNLGQAGWRRASAVLGDLRGLLAEKSGARLIIVSERQKRSKPVLLRDLKYETGYEGVYSVTLSLVEYVKPQAKTAGVPGVTRPGTRPVAPSTFEVASAYDNAGNGKNEQKTNGVEVPDSSIAYPPVFIDPKTGRTVNPAGLYLNTEVSVAKGQQSDNSATAGAIAEAYADYANSMGSE